MDEEILEFIGKVVAYGGGSAAAAYAIFVFLGKRWIENRFNKSLESHKHSQNKELEDLKFKINTYLNRINKIHEKEFEVLPEAWIKLNDALGKISSFVSPLQEYPDFNRMNEEQIKDILKDTKLTELVKKELIEDQDKVMYYRNKIFWYDYIDVRKSLSGFHNYIIANKIFLSTPIYAQFKKIDEIMWESLKDREVGKEAEDYQMYRNAYKAVKEEKIKPITDEIEKLVQERLHYNKVE